jgi:protein subunit release factor A
MVIKTESTVLMTHLPTGIQVRCETARSQQYNLQMAHVLLRARLWALEKDRLHGERSAERKRQVGSGMRGDKRRTNAAIGNSLKNVNELACAHATASRLPGVLAALDVGQRQ